MNIRTVRENFVDLFEMLYMPAATVERLREHGNAVVIYLLISLGLFSVDFTSKLLRPEEATLSIRLIFDFVAPLVAAVVTAFAVAAATGRPWNGAVWRSIWTPAMALGIVMVVSASSALAIIALSGRAGFANATDVLPSLAWLLPQRSAFALPVLESVNPFSLWSAVLASIVGAKVLERNTLAFRARIFVILLVLGAAASA